MEDSTERQKIRPELHKFAAIINQSSVIEEEGTPTRYRLKPTTDSHDESELYRKITFGERDKNKSHKTILMVGETGTGKTKLINTMINNILNVKREDKVWFEFTDDKSNGSSVHTQTSRITVYGFYLQESPIHLTIIDTPGYGDIHLDKEITTGLLSLSKSAEGIHEIDAVCLVVKATQNRLSDRQIYIFDAVQSLFGSDIAENIVLLFTHSRGAIPKNVLKAVEEAKIKCAVNDENQPVYFLFDNCQSEAADEDDDEDDEMLKQSWDLSCKEIREFFKFLKKIKPKTLKMTQNVLHIRKQLEANISKIILHIQETDQKQNDLKKTQEDLEQTKKIVEENKNVECEVDVPSEEMVDNNPAVAKGAICSRVCEENCHHPGWSFKDLFSSFTKADHCTVCTDKCQKSKHFKSAKVYETKTEKEKRTNEDSKEKYDDNMMKVRDGESSIKKLEEELQELEKEKIKLVNEAFDCVETLEMIALNTDSLFTLLHIDFLIEKLKEINEPEKAETLENIKKKAGEEKHRVLGYMKR